MIRRPPRSTLFPYRRSSDLTRNGGNFDCGSQGGMDDRFDQILVSQNVMNNSDNVEYQTGSYRAVGNDGNHFNSSLISGSNSMYPTSVVRSEERRVGKECRSLWSQ